MADTPSLVVLCLDTTFSCSQEHQDRWDHVNQLLTQPIDGLDDDSCGIGLSLEEAGCVYTICAREMCTQLYGMHLSPRLIGLEAFHLLTWNNLWRHLPGEFLWRAELLDALRNPGRPSPVYKQYFDALESAKKVSDNSTDRPSEASEITSTERPVPVALPVASSGTISTQGTDDGASTPLTESIMLYTSGFALNPTCAVKGKGGDVRDNDNRMVGNEPKTTHETTYENLLALLGRCSLAGAERQQAATRQTEKCRSPREKRKYSTLETTPSPTDRKRLHFSTPVLPSIRDVKSSSRKLDDNERSNQREEEPT